MNSSLATRGGGFVLFVLVLGGCASSQPLHIPKLVLPSNDRDWEPSLAVLPAAEARGPGTIELKNVRRCNYVTEDIYVTNYKDRVVDLARLATVDFVVVPFTNFPSLAHTMLSFGLDDGTYIGVSVEARLEKGESYSPTLGSLRQFELMYVVADEHDLITLRTLHRNADVYVYRAAVTRQQVRALFVDVMERVNKLHAKPEFYHTLTNNCTTNLVAHVNRLQPGLVPYSLQILLPGHSDKLAYTLGLLDADVPFETLRRQARVTERANEHHDSSCFSQAIRR